MRRLSPTEALLALSALAIKAGYVEPRRARGWAVEMGYLRTGGGGEGEADEYLLTATGYRVAHQVIAKRVAARKS